MIDVIIPTLHKSPVYDECLQSLRFIPYPYNLHVIQEGANWSHSVNLGLTRSKNDILLMDDDVILGPYTLSTFDPSIADIIGFTLRLPAGQIQQAGAFIKTLEGLEGKQRYYHEYRVDPLLKPTRMVHTSASLVYIHREVIDQIGGFVEWPGVQLEDVDFSFRALLAGFKIMCVPCEASHLQSATRLQFSNYLSRKIMNMGMLTKKYYEDPDFIAFLRREKWLT